MNRRKYYRKEWRKIRRSAREGRTGLIVFFTLAFLYVAFAEGCVVCTMSLR